MTSSRRLWEKNDPASSTPGVSLRAATGSRPQANAVKAVAMKGISIALACRAFEVSETCYRYSPKLDDENEQIADLLLGLTKAKKSWGFGLCFLYLRNVQG